MAGYNQITSLIKISILNTTNGEPASSVEADHMGTAAVEAEVAGAGAINRTAPIAAIGPNKAITAATVARRGQFKRRSKSTRAIVVAPT